MLHIPSSIPFIDSHSWLFSCTENCSVLWVKWSGEPQWKASVDGPFVLLQRLLKPSVNKRTMWVISLKILSVHPHSNVNDLSEKFFFSCWLFLLFLLFMFNGSFFLAPSTMMFLLRPITRLGCTLDNDISIKHYFCFIFFEHNGEQRGGFSFPLPFRHATKVKLLFRLLLTSSFPSSIERKI